MFINSLNIKDFKCLKDIDLKFDKRIVLFHGDNGQGKSALLNVLRFILKGDLSEKMSNYVRWGTESFFIDSSFNHVGKLFDLSIEGGLKGSASKRLIINNQIDDLFINSNATKKLKEYINSDVVLYSAISEQGLSQQLILEDPSERLRKLSQIFQIDKLTDLAEIIKNDARELTIEMDKLKSVVDIREQQKYILQDVPEIEDISDIKKQFKILESKKEIFELQKKLYDAYVYEKKKYNDLVDKLSNVLAEHKSSKEAKEVLEASLLTYDESAIEDLNKLQNELNNLLQERELYESELKFYNKTCVMVDDLKKAIDLNDQELQSIKIRRISAPAISMKEYDDLKNKILSMEADIRDENKNLKLAEAGKCPTCGQDYSVDPEIIKTKIKNIIASLNNFKDTLKKYDEEFENYNKSVAENIQLEDKKNSLLNSIKEKSDQIRKLETENSQPEWKGSDTRIEDLKIKIHNLLIEDKKIKETKAKNLEIEKAINQINSTLLIQENKIQELSKVTMNVPEEVKEPENFDLKLYKSIEEKIIINNTLKESRERLIEYNNKILKNKEENDKIINDSKEQIEKLQRKYQILNDTRQIIGKEFSAYLLDKRTNLVKLKMNDFFRRSYGRYEITFTQDKNSIEFFYYDNRHKVITPCSMASGFEKQVLSMANRVALCSLYNLGIMILDEIDDSADLDNSVRMLENLFNEKNINQFFVVSHNEYTKEFVSNYPNSISYKLENGEIVE